MTKPVGLCATDASDLRSCSSSMHVLLVADMLVGQNASLKVYGVEFRTVR